MMMVTYEELEKRWQQKPYHWCRQPHLTFADDGVLLGSDCVICKSGDRTVRGMTLQIDGDEGRILALLSLAYGKLIHPDVIKNFRNASRALAQGEKTLAAIHLCHAGLPRLDADADHKAKLLFQASQLLDDGMEPSELLKGLDMLPLEISGEQWSKHVKTVISCQGEARDENGRWTDSSGGKGNGGQSGSSVVPVAGQTDPTQAKKERFVAKHLSDAQKGADQLGVPVENILGLSALESGWGENSRFAVEGNNYFSIHYPAPYATGYMEAKDNGTKVSTFASYADSLKSFVSQFSGLVQGKSDPEEFAAALQNSGKYGVNPDGSKVSTFVSDTAKTIKGLRSVVTRGSRKI